MLTDLTIRNVGVIPSATIEFSPGLTVLTGETGAGKTMVVTGLRLLSGGRADAGRVRDGSAKAIVEGHVALAELDDAARAALLGVVEEVGGETDENGEVLLARQISAKGRSRAWVGGRTTTAALLGEAAGSVIAIHGQNDQLRLLGAAEQRAALDRLDPAATGPLLEDYRAKRAAWRAADRTWRERTERRREMALQADQLSFAIKEIDDVDPEPREDVELAATIRRLQDVDGLRAAAAGALANIDGAAAAAAFGADAGDGESTGAADHLGEAQSALTGTGDTELDELAARIGELAGQLTDVSTDLGTYLEALPAEEVSLDELLTRQAALKALTRKYAPDIAGVLAWRAKAERKLDSLDVSDEALDALAAEAERHRKATATAAGKLTKARRKLAERLAVAVTAELDGLAMPHAALHVDVTGAGSFGPDGADEVTFGLAAHPGAVPKPLATSASGGELSRVMLALEVVLAEGDAGRTLVFDEVDAGVGGRAAVEIGRRLARLAVRNQVIVVTHLPQVAAYADAHLHVAKDVSGDGVVSGVAELDREERIEELARMMAGLDGTASGRAHATDLLDRANADRDSWG